MERDERYEINSRGSIVVGIPETLTQSEKKNRIAEMFGINGWTYTLLEEVTSAHYHIELKNENLQIEKRFHLFHGNVRKEDPNRNREEKKIQLGTGNDPRQHLEDALILGFYVYENKNSVADTIVVAWPIEENKNYPENPSLRVNMRTDVMPAKNLGYYVDKTTGKKLVVFRPEFIYHYIENYKDLHYDTIDVNHTGGLSGDGNSDNVLESEQLSNGTNELLYGVPGAGKSYTIKNEYCSDESKIERVVFHPDYMNTDFIGQILPVVKADKTISYDFVPGPFTKILKKSYEDPSNNYYLIIEEINRGNAPAIFGDIFQLLDRDEKGRSRYSITNQNIAEIVFNDSNKMVYIPSNLTILATMNTADQNVFTLDTAFQRRWLMRMIKNEVEKAEHANTVILDTNVNWAMFAEIINKQIVDSNSATMSSEDKRLGAYFITKNDLERDSNKMNEDEFHSLFAEKVIKYLWDDAFKFGRDKLFNPVYKSLEDVIEDFSSKKGIARFDILESSIRDLLMEKSRSIIEESSEKRVDINDASSDGE